MNLLKEAKPEMAFLKLGIYGEAGSGKTYTSSKIAIGLYRFIKAKGQIGFLDTETGSDFVLPMFQQEKIKLLTAKTRAFKDLLTIVDEAEKSCSILIIDSITHFWNEMLDAYQKQHNLERISLRHWIPLKRTWREFTDRFVNSKIHIILAGRSAYIWDDVEDDEGVKELKKVGTKMRAETEMGYEPSLLMEMEKIRLSNKAGAKWVHRAWVVKDRFSTIDGKFFDNPGFDEVLPHVELLNLGGKHRAIDADRNSQEMFENEKTGEAKYRKQKSLIERIQNEIYLLYPGQDQGSKVNRINLLKDTFGTHAWTDIERIANDILEKGLKSIEKKNGKKEEKDETS